MFDASIVICSGSQYAHLFDQEAKKFSIHLLHRFNLPQLKLGQLLNTKGRKTPFIIDHPLGLTRFVKSDSQQNHHYLSCSWVSALQAASTHSAWEDFLWWRWACAYVYPRINERLCIAELSLGLSISKPCMPFFLTEPFCELKRRISVRVNGYWYELSEERCKEAQSIVDQIYQSPLLTMEWFLKDNQVHVLQIYPGIPWGHYWQNPESIVTIFEWLHEQFFVQDQFAIPPCLKRGGMAQDH